MERHDLWDAIPTDKKDSSHIKKINTNLEEEILSLKR